MITISSMNEVGDQVGLLDDINLGDIQLSWKELTMPRGMIGFEDTHHYSIELLEGEVIYRLVGAENSMPVFYLINPYLVMPRYSLAISDEEYDIIGKPKFDSIIVFAILTLKDTIEETTCNLLGPLLINNKNGYMLQVINNSNDWGTKHLISNGNKIIEASLVEG